MSSLNRFYRSVGKRILDVCLSVVGLILLAPLFAILALIIRLDSPGRVFFFQRRIGKDKREFNIIKFRTMRRDAPPDTPTHLFSQADEYITRFGRILRRTSLDELPQLMNVLKGDMALVGPRPALWNQFDLIAARDRTGAHTVLPGITGFAQTSGRDTISDSVKADFDGRYVREISFLTDLKCLLVTFYKAVKGEGIVDGTP